MYIAPSRIRNGPSFCLFGRIGHQAQPPPYRQVQALLYSYFDRLIGDAPSPSSDIMIAPGSSQSQDSFMLQDHPVVSCDVCSKTICTSCDAKWCLAKGTDVSCPMCRTKMAINKIAICLSLTHGAGGALSPRRTQTWAISKNQYLDVPENMT